MAGQGFYQSLELSVMHVEPPCTFSRRGAAMWHRLSRFLCEPKRISLFVYASNCTDRGVQQHDTAASMI